MMRSRCTATSSMWLPTRWRTVGALAWSELARNPSLATYVVDRLQAAWSPSKLPDGCRSSRRGLGSVTHETIYTFVYSPHGKALGLLRHLPMARQCRRTRYVRTPRGPHNPT